MNRNELSSVVDKIFAGSENSASMHGSTRSLPLQIFDILTFVVDDNATYEDLFPESEFTPDSPDGGTSTTTLYRTVSFLEGDLSVSKFARRNNGLRIFAADKAAYLRKFTEIAVNNGGTIRVQITGMRIQKGQRRDGTTYETQFPTFKWVDKLLPIEEEPENVPDEDKDEENAE